MQLFEKPQGTFPVAPLMGFPGARLTGTAIMQNLENAEVQYQSLEALYRRYRPDAMITMMDLSVEAEAIGLNVVKPDNASYTVKEHPVKTDEDLQGLKVPDPLKDGRMPVFLDVVRKMKAGFDCPSMAYVIGPYTLAGLLTGANNVIKNVLKKPDLVHEMLQYCSQVVTIYGNALIAAGVDALIVLEPTATVLPPKQFNSFSGQYVSEIFKNWTVPSVLHICGDTTLLIPEMIKTGCAGISIDSMVNMEDTIKRLPDDILLIGNIDPVNSVAFAPQEELIKVVNGLLKTMEQRYNFVLSTGCDLPPETSLENLAIFIDLAKNYSGRI
jgi:uroporphyrinogen decarboxylase